MLPVCAGPQNPLSPHFCRRNCSISGLRIGSHREANFKNRGPMPRQQTGRRQTAPIPLGVLSPLQRRGCHSTPASRSPLRRLKISWPTPDSNSDSYPILYPQTALASAARPDKLKHILLRQKTALMWDCLVVHAFGTVAMVAASRSRLLLRNLADHCFGRPHEPNNRRCVLPNQVQHSMRRIRSRRIYWMETWTKVLWSGVGAALAHAAGTWALIWYNPVSPGVNPANKIWFEVSCVPQTVIDKVPVILAGSPGGCSPGAAVPEITCGVVPPRPLA